MRVRYGLPNRECANSPQAHLLGAGRGAGRAASFCGAVFLSSAPPAPLGMRGEGKILGQSAALPLSPWESISAFAGACDSPDFSQLPGCYFFPFFNAGPLRFTGRPKPVIPDLSGVPSRHDAGHRGPWSKRRHPRKCSWRDRRFAPAGERRPIRRASAGCNWGSSP